MTDPMVVRKSLLLFKKEATPGTLETMTAASDAVLVEEAAWETDFNLVDRNFYYPDLSPQPKMVGRKLGRITFTHELRGNDLEDSGSVSDAPRLAKFLEACGFALSAANSAATRIGTVHPVDGNVGSVTWAKGGTLALTAPALYTILCTTAGGSGVAEVSITCNNPAVDAAPDTAVEITDSTPITLSGSGATLTPTVVSALAVGDKWHVLVTPVGVVASVQSGNYARASLSLYKDGKLHSIAGSMGTFDVKAEAGGRAVAKFTFTGVYQAAVDAAFPANPVFEGTTCPLVEKSLLSWGGDASMVIGDWTFDLSASVTPRPDVNSPEGVRGMWNTARGTRGGFTPEATLEADHPFWADMAAATRKHFFVKTGQVAGNMVLVEAPYCQTDTLGYGDRDGLLTYDIGMMFTRGHAGDDEVRFVFC